MVSVHSRCVDSSTGGKKVKRVARRSWSNTRALRVHMFRDETFVCLSTLRVLIILISGVLCYDEFSVC